MAHQNKKLSQNRIASSTGSGLGGLRQLAVLFVRLNRAGAVECGWPFVTFGGAWQ
jgi:hypothetical protein